ncbi:magnesium transporter NIPA-domain-containing protein [Glomus cerebriforme]|uniref:Magnesium transporter NIPA-domain-containing protein n=1 Tax=Glomus cerebriforme TaxID=658196 RepID=A0A397S2I9_9GLOM|nr:magnesium transporter NIPA-domain-containing protein [Glomus cerebriforme]
MLGYSPLMIENEKSDNTPQFNPLVGIVIAVSTSFIQSLGLTIQRKSHVLNENIHPKELRRSACKRPLWHLGFDTYIISNIIGSIFSIGYLPIIILAPLGAVTLVFNAIFAKLLLGDIFNRQTIIGTIFIIIGAIMIALFGVVEEPKHSLKDLIELYKRPAFISYFSVIEFTIIVILIVNKYGEYVLEKMNRNERDPIFGWPIKKFQTILGISYGCVGGMLSSQGLIFAKSGVELLILTIYGENQFNGPLSWIIVAGLVIVGILQLYYLNKGLRLCDTVVLVPLSFCTFNASTIFNGLMYYNQWNRLHWWQIVLVILGICILLCGVLVLSWRKSTAPEEEFLVGEERLLLGRDVEGLTELYDDDDDFYEDTLDLNDYSDEHPLEGNSSNTGMFAFEEMLDDDENDDSDEKTSLLSKRSSRNSRNNNRLIHGNYGI